MNPVVDQVPPSSLSSNPECLSLEMEELSSMRATEAPGTHEMSTQGGRIGIYLATRMPGRPCAGDRNAMARPLRTQLTPVASLDHHTRQPWVSLHLLCMTSASPPGDNSVLSVRLYRDITRWIPAQAWYLLTHHMLVHVWGEGQVWGELSTKINSSF